MEVDENTTPTTVKQQDGGKVLSASKGNKRKHSPLGDKRGPIIQLEKLPITKDANGKKVQFVSQPHKVKRF